uniref:hypothetical protein n=1 Tax=Marinilabilia salmonicolor TaxID=989 RepID=UPI00029AE0D2
AGTPGLGKFLTFTLRGRPRAYGYFPDNSETEESLECAENAMNYVAGLLKQKKNKYPEVYKYLNK